MSATSHVRLTRSPNFMKAMLDHYGVEPRLVRERDLKATLPRAMAHAMTLTGDQVSEKMSAVDLSAPLRGRFLKLEPVDLQRVGHLVDHWTWTLGRGPRTIVSKRYVVIAALYLFLLDTPPVPID